MDNFIMKSSLTGDGTIRVHSGSQKEEKAMTKMTKKQTKKNLMTIFLPLWTNMGQVAHSAGQVIFTCHLTMGKSCQKYLSVPGQTYSTLTKNHYC